MFYFNDSLAYVFLHSQDFHKIGVFNVNLLDNIKKSLWKHNLPAFPSCWGEKQHSFISASKLVVVVRDVFHT